MRKRLLFRLRIPGIVGSNTVLFRYALTTHTAGMESLPANQRASDISQHAQGLPDVSVLD